MRPEKLVMRAFGPYAGEEVINFSELGNRSLFLIHGPTGSGKTTILDAICFALYGRSSGDERQSKHMRSDHAADSSVTEVEFEFRLGQQFYRVLRRPEQEVSSKRGTGSRTIKHEAQLWKLANGQAQGSWQLFAGGPARVTEQVQELLGLRDAQFKQVVMLPQGQFMQLLAANSKERQQILEVLFQTSFYRQVEEALREAARDLENRAKDKKQQQALILEQAEAESFECLVEKKKAAEEHAGELADQLKALDAGNTAAQDKLNQARQILQRLNELGEAKLALESLENGVPTFQDKRSVLAQARKAATLIPDSEAQRQRIKEAEQANARLKAAQSELQKAELVNNKAAARLKAEEDREEERGAARLDLGRLQELTIKVTDLRGAEYEFALAKQAALEARQRLADASKELEDSVGLLEAFQEKLQHAQKAVAQIELIRTLAQETERNVQARRQSERLLKDKARLKDELEKPTGECAALYKALSSAQTEYSVLENAWIEGQAAILATRLVPGGPCPVCGSREHPQPARSEKELPDEEDLKAKKQQIANLTDSRDRAERHKVSVEKKLAEVEASGRTLHRNLGDLAAKTLKELEAESIARKKELDGAERARQEEARLKRDFEVLEKAVAEAKTKRPKVEKLSNEAEARFERARAVLEDRKSGIPDHLRDPLELERAIAEALNNLKKLETALEMARTESSTVGEHFAGCAKALEVAKITAMEAAERSASQRREFTQRLSEAGFPKEESFRDAVRSREEIAGLDAAIQDFDARLSAARDRFARASQVAEKRAKPDLEKLEMEAASAKEALEKCIGGKAGHEEKLASLKRSISAYEKALEEYESIDSEYRVVGTISDAANGHNNENITFQRFVLATLLDDVLIAASERLRRMSSGRFGLRRVLEQADRRRAGGLELEVDDTYTGTTRPVSTLSGGESFLAALALALGLAEVVQTYAGGIHLDTIFVDEGFGTLDPEALELAYRTLADLQIGGRLVGIISHVPELQELIPTRLEVIPTRNGSTARFALA